MRALASPASAQAVVAVVAFFALALGRGASAEGAPPSGAELIREAARERIGGCWPEAETKLILVLRRGAAGEARSRALAELAHLRLEQGDAITAEGLAREAIEAAATPSDRAHALNALILALSRIDPYVSELPDAIQWLSRISDTEPADDRIRVLALLSQARYAQQVHRWGAALPLLRMAEELAEPASVDQGVILSIRTASLRAVSSPDAVATGERALDILRSVAPEGFQLASCFNALAIARFESGDHDGALADFKRSLAIRERLSPGGAESGLAFMNLATMIRFAGGDLVEAEQMVRKAVTLYQGLERIVPLERLRSLVRWTGRLYLETEILCQLVDLIESRPLESLSDAARQGIRWWEGNIVGRLGPHFARLGFPEEALEATERARGRAFLAARRARAGAPGESQARKAQIKATRNRYDAAQRALLGLDANSQGSAADGYRAELFRLRLELESLEARAQVPRQGFRPLTVTEIREGLGDGTLALVVATGSEAGLEGFTAVLAVKHGEPVRSVVLPHGSQTLWPKVNAYRRLVSRTTAGAPGPELLKAGEELSCLLLDPFRDLLADARRLVVSVGEMVAPLPFEALVVDRGESGPVFLAERFPISYASSLTALLEARPKPGATDLPLWSVGDPGTGSQVDALPGARVEAQTVADFHPGEAHVLIGERATEEAVKGIPPTAGTLHFACHATVDPEHPEDSALLLAQPAPGSSENGRLRGWEIVNELSLNADLVVLSACASSGAVNTPTEGPLGLAYAFQVAGARRVLAARWQVPDEVAGRFMEAFYSARARGLAADRCLQEAQVALRSNPETAHPYFWAGFVLHGDGR